MTTKQLPCNANLIERYLDGELGPGEQEHLERHLDSCAACRRQTQRAAANADWWTSAGQMLQPDAFDEQYESTTAERADWPDMVGVVVAKLDASDDPRMLGRFAGYEIVGVVGNGGMGVVLKGFEPSLNRFVAIKVMAPHLAASAAARRRFAREAQAAASVLHPNVIAIHQVSQHNGLPFLVMPYFGGVSLQKRIDDEGPLPVAAVVRIGMQIATGLSAAHAQGLIHRDIKPANILLEQDVERVVITDFGLARAVDDASITQEGVLPGTPQYMSPEQSRGEAVGLRSDLFSLGSVMYAMCAGRPPFRAETSLAVLRRIADYEPRPLHEINPDVPCWLARIVARLHAKQPSERFESAEHAARLLEGCLAHLQQPAATALPAELASPSRNPSAAALPVVRRFSDVAKIAGAVAACLVVFVLLFALLAHRSPKPIDRLDAGGFSQLHRAAMAGQLSKTKVLLEDGADVNVLQRKFEGTPLQYAAANGHVKVINALIDHGAYVEATDIHGRTPLMWAAMKGRTAVAKVLLERGARVNSKARGGWTPLHYARQGGHDETAQLLIKRGADASAKNVLGKTPHDVRKTPEESEAPDDQTSAAPPAGWFRPDPLSELGGPQIGQQDVNILQVVFMSRVQEDIDADEMLRRALAEVSDRWTRAEVKLLSRLSFPGESPPESELRRLQKDVQQKSRALRKEARAEVDELLSTAQRERVEQILFQRFGHRVFFYPELAPQLKLTPAQQEQLHGKFQEHLKRVKNIRAADRQESYKRFWLEAHAILTPAQRSTFEKLRGHPLRAATRALPFRKLSAKPAAEPQLSAGEAPAAHSLSRQAGKPNEIIGSVLGESVRRSQIQKGSPVTSELHRLFSQPLMEKYKQAHQKDLQLSEEEIAAAVRYHEQRAKVEGGNVAESWQRVVSNARQDAALALAKAEKQLAAEDFSEQEKERLEQQKSEAEKMLLQPGRRFVVFFYSRLKFQQHLYRQYGGGRVLWQQFGVEAFDATHRWLREREQAGDFAIDDEPLREQFYEYWTTQSHGSFLKDPQDKKNPEALRFPWEDA